VRLPKEIYFVDRVMQNEKPDIHIIGHWSYPLTQPDGSKTVKTIYVVANNVDAVELFVNGKSKGKLTTPDSGYLYTFPDIAFAPGTIKAVGYWEKVAATQELRTAGPPAAIKLTLHTAPGGMRADGEDYRAHRL
jgi:beta-galactosidase